MSGVRSSFQTKGTGDQNKVSSSAMDFVKLFRDFLTHPHIFPDESRAEEGGSGVAHPVLFPV
jgi:hypothetical protein